VHNPALAYFVGLCRPENQGPRRDRAGLPDPPPGCPSLRGPVDEGSLVRRDRGGRRRRPGAAQSPWGDHDSRITAPSSSLSPSPTLLGHLPG
jgi:hypothetical protein